MSLERMKAIISSRAEYTFAWFGPEMAPLGILFNGKRMAIATDGHLLVAVPTEEELPEPRAEVFVARVYALLETPPAEPHEVNTARLKKWAGVPLGRDIYFTADGTGPHTVPNNRPCVLFGIELDADKLAHALQVFESETVNIRVGGDKDPVHITDGHAVATVMPRLIPRWTAKRGPIRCSGYGDGRDE